jgi:Fanconi anemia group M protein
VDHRELNGPLPRLIAQKGIRTQPTNLSIGDVVVSNRVIVERKRARDFVTSILDGRLLEQARLLKRNFEAPLMIIEGDPFAESGGVRPEAIAGALAALTGSLGITVLTVADVQQAASVVAALARREQEEGKGPPALRHGTAGRETDEQQRFLVEGLPQVSGTLAQRLLHHFGSPAAVFAASEEGLRKVRGIGPVTAKSIHDVLHTTFDQPWPSATSTASPARDPATPCGTGAARSAS